MNKKIIMAIGAMALAAVLGLVFSQTLSVSADPDLSEEDVTDMVLTQYPGEITNLELTSIENDPVYEVEILLDEKSYLLTIDGNSGEVIELDEKSFAGTDEKTQAELAMKQEDSVKNKKETALEKKEVIKLKKQEEKAEKEEETTEKETVEAPTNKEEKQENQTEKKQESQKKKNEESEKKSTISIDEAVSIALNQFSGYVDDVDLDTEDGRLIYEIEIESERGEAEIEIDAYTGEVLVVDIDLDD